MAAGPWAMGWAVLEQTPLQKRNIFLFIIFLAFSHCKICKITMIRQFLMVTSMLCKNVMKRYFLCIKYCPVSQQTCKHYGRVLVEVWQGSQRIIRSCPSWLCTGKRGEWNGANLTLQDLEDKENWGAPDCCWWYEVQEDRGALLFVPWRLFRMPITMKWGQLPVQADE